MTPAGKRAAVLTHTQPEQTAEALRRVAEIAAESGWSLVTSAEERDKHGDAASGLEVARELPEDVDLCLVLGGDGTILKGLRTFAGTDVPVFAVNFGTIGFLAAVEREALDDGARAAFDGTIEVIEIPGLEVEVGGHRMLALNDLSLVRTPHSRIAELSYRLGGKEVGHVRCDGLVAATPVGSTGYNLANQGPILAWGVEGFVVSFVAPHTLTARPLVVAPNDVLEVINAAGRDSVDVAIDGEHVGELASGAATEVRFRDRAARLAQLPGANFYRRVRDKFGRLAH